MAPTVHANVFVVPQLAIVCELYMMDAQLMRTYRTIKVGERLHKNDCLLVVD